MTLNTWVYIHWPARSWLKTFGQFWCSGGGYWCAIFPDWCKPGAEVGLGCFLGIGWPVHRNQKLVLEIPFFGFKILFFGENMVLRFHFLVLRFHFLGLRSVDEISARFPRNCQRNPKWWSQQCITMCLSIFPPSHQNWPPGQFFLANQGFKHICFL